MDKLSYISEDASSSSSIWLLIRHSERVQPPLDKPFLDAGLTENGYRDAIIFGRHIKRKFPLRVMRLYSSPLKRCIETSKAILSGIGEKIEIEESIVLGDPGPYVINDSLARRSFLDIQPKNIIKMQVDGAKIEGFRDIDEGSAILLDYILNHPPPKGLHIFVTHDVIIAALVGYLIGYVVDQPNRIKYLQGACFYLLNNRILMDVPEGQFDVTDKILSLLPFKRRFLV